MNTLAIVFFAALAFHATLARSIHSQAQQNHEVQDLLTQIRTVSNEAATSVQNTKLDTELAKHSLYAQANEYAHDIHEIVHYLNQAIFHNQGGKGQETLQEVAQTLGGIVYSVQQAIHHEPTYLKSQLQTDVQSVIEQAEHLAQVAQQELKTRDVNDEVQDVLDDLLVAVHKIRVHNQILGQTQQEVSTRIQNVVEQVSGAIQNVVSNSVDSVDDLVHYSHHLAYHFGEIVHQLQREAQHHNGEVLNVIEQVLTKITEVRADLEKVSQDTKVSELKDQLKTNVHNVAVQIERLFQLTTSGKLDEHEIRNIRNLVRLVAVDAVVAVRQLQRNLEFIVRNSQQY